MGAREDVVAAAQRLTARGEKSFGPLDVLAEARSGGSMYPDETIRTQFVAHLSVTDPSDPTTPRRPLRRVARGRYTLEVDPAATAPSPASRPPVDSTTEKTAAIDEWHWEGNVQNAVVADLVGRGWTIVRVADTKSREHGHDVVAERGPERVIVEVKGYPSSRYVSGEKAGQRKPTSPNTQARHWFAMALLAGATMRSSEADSEVALALPDFTTYRNLTDRTRPALRAMGVQVWLIDASGQVEHLVP